MWAAEFTLAQKGVKL